MTIITSILRSAHRVLGVAVKRSAGALCAHVEAIRWRRRVLRALDQRRRG